MSKIKNIVLRIQSSEGTKRIDVSPDDSVRALYEKVHDAFALTSFAFSLFRNRDQKEELISSRGECVASSRLRHGDLLFLYPHEGATVWPHHSSGEAVGSSNAVGQTGGGGSQEAAQQPQPGPSGAQPSVTEHQVDQILATIDGKVQRQRDEKLCRHGKNACCVHCSPLEPYDDSHLREQAIKHLSFHAYLRKLTAGVDRGKFVALEDISCRIKTGCKGHPPWPKGICSKCQPNAITLNRQVYRHVDNVMFENAGIVERFLDYWRVSGHQRLGFLYGKYELHSDVPLGIRATVAAIYEPPQESTRDRIRLLPDEREKAVDELAGQLGLVKVGWIFTDLVADDVQKGTVKHVRNIDSHFLSAQECIMAGHFQNLNPNPCKLSSTGYFGSKFVTVCVTGDVKKQVHMEGYAVSSQCMALVRDDCLVPTKDMPQLGYIRESTDKQYVPDVYYKEKDSYGNEISKIARPLPVEYLLVDVPVSTPLSPVHTFRHQAVTTPFPVENRLLERQIQDFPGFCAYMQKFSREEFLDAVSDFHVLIYIATMDMFPMKDCMGGLLEAVKEDNGDKGGEWSRREDWEALEELMSSLGGGGPGGAGGAGGSSSSAPHWVCPHCTFINPPHLSTCDICSLPRS